MNCLECENIADKEVKVTTKSGQSFSLSPGSKVTNIEINKETSEMSSLRVTQNLTEVTEKQSNTRLFD